MPPINKEVKATRKAHNGNFNVGICTVRLGFSKVWFGQWLDWRLRYVLSEPSVRHPFSVRKLYLYTDFARDILTVQLFCTIIA